MKVKVSLSRVQLVGIPWTVAQPGSSVRGILQARIMEWESSQPRDQTWVSHLNFVTAVTIHIGFGAQEYEI